MSSTPSLPALRVLLIHGLRDTDVPATLSVAFAAAAWSHPRPAPVSLLLLPEADHYEVAALMVEPATLEEVAAVRLAAVGHGDGGSAGGIDGQAAAGRDGTAADGGGPAAPRAWVRVAAALRSFVTCDDPSLDALCTPPTTAPDAVKRLVSAAVPPVCARNTLGQIAAHDETWTQAMAADPAKASKMARGLRRWFEWVGEVPGEVLERWLETHAASS